MIAYFCHPDDLAVFSGWFFLLWCSGLYCLKSVLCCWSSKVLCRSSIVLALLTQACHRLDELLLCPSSASTWAQVTGTSFSVPFFCLSMGTGDRGKLLCALPLPQRGHRWQGQASLCPSSASAWAQVTGASFSVPFFCLNVGTGDRNKLLCTLLLPQRGHRWQGQASLCPSSSA